MTLSFGGKAVSPTVTAAAFKAFTRAAYEGRISTAPPAVQIPGEEFEIDEEEEAAERFGDELTAGVNALPPSESTDALEERFGIITDWLLAHNGFHLDAAGRTTLLRRCRGTLHPPLPLFPPSPAR